MGYSQWSQKQAKKHKSIIEKLCKEGYDKEAIIAYFDFENMREKERDFCPLYAKNKKCHDMQELNCYLCACPNFRYSDDGIKAVDGKIQYSYCNINSKDGRQGIYADKIHQDCSGCQVPHTKEYVREHFELDWMAIMADCEIKPS
jgi:hypothetical protein